MKLKSDPKFQGIKPFEHKVYLSSPTMHGEELRYMTEAYETNWMSTVGKNIDALERAVSEYIGISRSVALSSGTAAIHLAVKLAAERLYGSSSGISTPDGLGRGGSLYGRRVFCSDMTFDATVNPVVYEGGEPVFIDTEYDTWNMSPEALEQAFERYPDVKLVVMVHLYGTPGKVAEIRELCDAHGALLLKFPVGQHEDGNQPGKVPQILLAAAAQHHKGLPRLGLLLEKMGLHGGHVLLRGVAEPPDPAGGEDVDGAFVEAGQLIQLQVVLMGNAVQNALVVQGQAEALGQLGRHLVAAAAELPADGD